MRGHHEKYRGEALTGISEKFQHGLSAIAPAAAAMASAATQTNGSIPTHVTDDPVFAAVEKHRQAVQAWQAAPGET
jgi:hypothetical protein